MKPARTACTGEGCPLTETCQRHLDNIDKTTMKHFGVIPYSHEAKKCNFYLFYDPLEDPLFTPNYEEKRDPFPEQKN